MSQVIEINSENFESEVLQANQAVIVDFAAEWCGPCKQLAPIVKELAEELDGSAKVCHLDIDNCQDIALKYGIMSVPTVLFFKDGSVQEKTVGLVPKDTLLEKYNSVK